MFTFVCTRVYVHDQISIQRHMSTMGNHDYVQFVAFDVKAGIVKPDLHKFESACALKV